MPDISGHLLARRDLLKRGVVVGGTVVWTVPVVQALTMTSSTAAVPSGTPGGGGTTTPGGSGTGGTGGGSGSGVDAVTIHRGDGSASGVKGAAGSSSGSQPLASTGPAVPVGEALVYGVGAVAVGGALLAAGRSKRPSPVASGAGAHRRPQLPRT